MKLVFSTLASRVGTTMRRYAGPRQYRPLRLEALEERFFLAANVWLDFTDFGTELNKAVAKANETLDPDVTPFSTSEINDIEQRVISRTRSPYDALSFAHDLNFITSATSPYTQLHYGAVDTRTGQAAEVTLGEADQIDELNSLPTATQNDRVRVFPAKFDDFVGHICPSTPGAVGCLFGTDYPTEREGQIIEISNALGYVGGHELGHSFGLFHQHAYGDPSIGSAVEHGLPDAGKVLNIGGDHFDRTMASGASGQTLDFPALSDLHFSLLSETILRYTPGVAQNIPGQSPLSTVTESTAQGSDQLAEITSGVKAMYVKQAMLTTDTDIYPFTANAGDTLTVAVGSLTFDTGITNQAYAKISITDASGRVLYAPIDPDGPGTGLPAGEAVSYGDGNQFNSGAETVGLDTMYANLPILEAGNYRIEVSIGTLLGSALGGDGQYDLVVTLRSFFVDLEGGTLFVYGTEAADTVQLSVNGANLDVTINGSVVSKPLASINAIVVELGRGNDQLTVSTSVNMPIHAIGGPGDDILQGGAGDDTLDGGPGNDTYDYNLATGQGTLGNDSIIEPTGAGTDLIDLYGVDVGLGANLDMRVTSTQIVIGDVNNPYLKLTGLGDQEIEQVIGTKYDDTIHANDLNNSLFGEEGNDYLWGHGGSDFINPGLGNDFVNTGFDSLVDYILLADGMQDAADVEVGVDQILSQDANDTIF